MRLLGITLVLGVVACAPARPPQELVDARAAYARAHAGPAIEANASGLADAKKALDEAEDKFADSPSSPEVRDLAYIAQRRVLVAEANARANIAEAEKAHTEAILAKLREKQETKDTSERKARERRERNDDR